MVSNVFIEGSTVGWEDLGAGIQRKILGFDKQVMMALFRFKKGSIGALHRHVHTQVSFVESGSVEVRIGNEKKILHAGDSFLIPSNVDHGVIALEESLLVDVFAPMREDFIKP